MTNVKKRRLSLTRETLRPLQPAELAAAAGGFTTRICKTIMETVVSSTTPTKAPA